MRIKIANIFFCAFLTHTLLICFLPPCFSIAGISRSSTIVAAYLIVVANVGWQDAIQAIRMCRSVANPNYGFQRQLEDFELKKAGEVTFSY